ncbi:MAG: AAA family ATPase [Candidatus Nanopelagicales bacterium]
MPRTVTLLTGPPCAGKSWHVEQHAQPGDLILCIDTLAREAGSPHQHNHQPEHYAAAQRRYDHLATQLGHTDDAQAWVIRCAPQPARRAALAATVRATRTVVLLPPIGLALARARTRDRSPDLTEQVIRRWYRTWQQADGDEVHGTPPTPPTW